MIKSLEINEELEKYISDHSYDLHPVQKEILNYNNSLGEIKNANLNNAGVLFQHFIKTNNIKYIRSWHFHGIQRFIHGSGFTKR